MKMREKQRGREGLKQSEERERTGIHMTKHLPKVIQDVPLAEGMIKDIQQQPRSYVHGEASRDRKGVLSRMHHTYIRRAIHRCGVKTVCDRQGKSLWRSL